eukprot:CAMPEP_0118930864 /NCGR_PEP_ID=MMETSP1169-20130426/7406_1 /TAXON_ID=36882 /ORGANISM="Pyramimonas obovata, Strain CCMP722" /LENGTH=244 /DNA_ID=CAMNT_0006873285 /DNA_START=160 /DNA_END=890 /DNA_ORIENTATION=+
MGGATKDGVKNHYAGWRPSAGCAALNRVHINSITPREFFDAYVAKRRPVVIEGYLQEDTHAGKLVNWKKDSYLLDKAGDAQVRVEVRESTSQGFAARQYTPMKFRKFMEGFTARNELHYLTTEAVCEDEQGRLEVISPPVDSLLEDIPLSPPIMGHQLLASLNMWMGNSREGASSGLHHDYHDNLYVLLRGCKRFQMYCPGDAPKMYTNGALARVHSNGRINYEGDPTRADGANPAVMARVARG